MRIYTTGKLNRFEDTEMNKIKFTLAGKTISKSKEAHAIWLQALREDLDYLVPQAKSVQRQLEAVGQ
jgi:hypothetical protein